MDKIRPKGGTEADWIAIDPVLMDRELVLTIGLDGKPNGLKAGDGVSKWSELPYMTGLSSVESDPVFLAWLASYVETIQVNADWNAISGAAKILNKPTLGSIASKDFWGGTLVAYTAITTKNANTIYFIEE